jgi:hypothetical protein
MRSRLNAILPVLVMVAIGLALAYIGHRVSTLDHDLDESKADRANLRALLNEQESASQTLAEQVRQLGGKPAVEPGDPKPGPAGPAPTEAQVRAAVADYCGTGNRCKPTVSRSQIAEAVADYCAKGACIGDRGRDGKDGSTGPQGPGPTSDQIATAVAAYCAGGKCTGPAGKDGKDGAPGAPGKDGAKGDTGTSVSGVECDRGTGTFVFTFSDGSSRTVECSPLG